jgi:hypothetical protein
VLHCAIVPLHGSVCGSRDRDPRVLILGVTKGLKEYETCFVYLSKNISWITFGKRGLLGVV